MRPWWETHPREYWTATDRRAAREAGVPPLPEQPLDPAIRLIAESTPKVATLEPGQTREERRRIEADRALDRWEVR